MGETYNDRYGPIYVYAYGHHRQCLSPYTLRRLPR